MTPIAALVIAAVSGFLLGNVRQARIAVVAPYLGVVAAQTWYLGSGRGTNPASDVANPGYWLVQAIVGAMAVGIAGMLAGVRLRRARAERRSMSSHGLTVAGTVTGALAALTTLGVMFALDRPATPGSGSGGPPAAGMVGLLGCILSLLVLTAVRLRGRRNQLAASSGAAARRPG